MVRQEAFYFSCGSWDGVMDISYFFSRVFLVLRSVSDALATLVRMIIFALLTLAIPVGFGVVLGLTVGLGFSMLFYVFDVLFIWKLYRVNRLFPIVLGYPRALSLISLVFLHFARALGFCSEIAFVFALLYTSKLIIFYLLCLAVSACVGLFVGTFLGIVVFACIYREYSALTLVIPLVLFAVFIFLIFLSLYFSFTGSIFAVKLCVGFCFIVFIIECKKCKMYLRHALSLDFWYVIREILLGARAIELWAEFLGSGLVVSNIGSNNNVLKNLLLVMDSDEDLQSLQLVTSDQLEQLDQLDRLEQLEQLEKEIRCGILHELPDAPVRTGAMVAVCGLESLIRWCREKVDSDAAINAPIMGASLALQKIYVGYGMETVNSFFDIIESDQEIRGILGIGEGVNKNTFCNNYIKKRNAVQRKINAIQGELMDDEQIEEQEQGVIVEIESEYCLNFLQQQDLAQEGFQPIAVRPQPDIVQQFIDVEVPAGGLPSLHLGASSYWS